MRRIFVLLCGALLVGCGNTAVSNTEENKVQQEVTNGEISNNQIEDEHPTTEKTEEKTEESKVDQTDVIYIQTEGFVEDMDKVFTDLENYEGKTLSYEGVLIKTDEASDQYAVIRTYDVASEEHTHSIYVGLEISYEGELPEVDSWVKVMGVIERANSDGEDYPILKIEEIEVMPEKGELKVSN